MTDLLKKYEARCKYELSDEEFEQCDKTVFLDYLKSREAAKYGEFRMILSKPYGDYKEVVDRVKELGFTEFYITDSWSNAIERLGTLPDYCVIDGVHKICIGELNQIRYMEPEYGYGLRILIKEENV